MTNLSKAAVPRSWKIGVAERGLGRESYTVLDLHGHPLEQTFENVALEAAAPEMYTELYRALAVIRNPQAFDIEGVCGDIEVVLSKARPNG
jgi:hypothetical protein